MHTITLRASVSLLTERLNSLHVILTQSAPAHTWSIVADRWTLTVAAADVHHEHGEWHHETDAEWSARAFRAQPPVYCHPDDAPPHGGQPAHCHRADLSGSQLPLVPRSLGEMARVRLHRVGVHRLVWR